MASWREDPVQVRRWIERVVRVCLEAGWSQTEALDLAGQWAEALGIPTAVFHTARQLLALDEEADEAFRRLEQA